ncbi:MAG: VOC family protein [Caulobacteraceae bacterium]
MDIIGIDHINISTDRLAETVAFFRDALGLKEGWRPAFGAPGAWLYEGERALVHLGVRSEPQAPSTQAALDHFAFSIADIAAARARLTKAKVAFREIEVPGGSARQIFLTDPNGVAIELNWRAAKSG